MKPHRGAFIRFCTISDIHAHPSKPENLKILMAFLNSPQVQNSHKIFFLGDIFDVMIGDHHQYFTLYEVFLKKLAQLSRQGIEIHYFEGNHDFHLKKFFKSFSRLYQLAPIYVHRDTALFQIDQKTMHFSHGDLVELGKPRYKLFRHFIRSFPLQIVADYLIPYALLNWIGNTLSQRSKKKNHRYELNQQFLESVKQHFRKSVEQRHQLEKFDYIFTGHAHVSDHFKSQQSFEYFNAGPCFHTKQFLFYDEGLVSFCDIH